MGAAVARFDEQAGELEKVRVVVDGLAAQVYQRCPWLPCRQGCDGCCQATLWGISDAEGRALARAVARLEPDARQRVQERAQSQLEGLYRRHGRTADWRQMLAGEGSRDAACPLLEEGGCLVYAERPLVCRTYGVSEANSLGKRYWCDLIIAEARRHWGPVELLDLDWLYGGIAAGFRRRHKPIAAWVV